MNKFFRIILPVSVIVLSCVTFCYYFSNAIDLIEVVSVQEELESPMIWSFISVLNTFLATTLGISYLIGFLKSPAKLTYEQYKEKHMEKQAEKKQAKIEKLQKQLSEIEKD